MIEDDITTQESQETAPAQDETAQESTTQGSAGNDGKTESTGTGSSSDQPSGGDTGAGEMGNAEGSTTGAPPSTPENIDGAKPDTVSEQNISEQTGDEDPAEAAYEADRLAAVANGDTSWPTWGFLELSAQMEYIAKAG